MIRIGTRGSILALAQANALIVAGQASRVLVIGGGDGGTATAARTVTTNLTLGEGTYWLSFLGQRLTPHPTIAENYGLNGLGL